MIETAEELEVLDMTEQKFYVSFGMRTFGGSFFRKLGDALASADMNNGQLVKTTWPDEWSKYLFRGFQYYVHGRAHGIKTANTSRRRESPPTGDGR